MASGKARFSSCLSELRVRRGMLQPPGKRDGSTERKSEFLPAPVRELRRLVDEGLLRQVGEKRGAHYLPGPKLGQ